MFVEEVLNNARYFVGVSFEREMARVEEVNLRARNVALEGLGACGQEEGIVPAPDSQEGRLFAAEILLKLRIERDIAGIVEKQIELDVAVSWPGQE
jgi:hypothetical protein